MQQQIMNLPYTGFNTGFTAFDGFAVYDQYGGILQQIFWTTEGDCPICIMRHEGKNGDLKMVAYNRFECQWCGEEYKLASSEVVLQHPPAWYCIGGQTRICLEKLP
jgi:hypothetical protein